MSYFFNIYFLAVNWFQIIFSYTGICIPWLESYYFSNILDMNKYLAEVLGTAVLVLVGCGSAVIAGGEIGYLGISLAFGLAVLTMVYAIGPISGCHINPAITIAMWFKGDMSMNESVKYIISQLIGAVIGAALIYMIAADSATLGANAVNAGYSVTQALTTEIVFTALFILVVLGVTAKKAAIEFAGLAIGLSLAMIHMVTIPITNTSVNPARSFGPALLNGDFTNFWIFVVWPIVGAILAVLIWNCISPTKKTKKKKK